MQSEQKNELGGKRREVRRELRYTPFDCHRKVLVLADKQECQEKKMKEEISVEEKLSEEERREAERENYTCQLKNMRIRLVLIVEPYDCHRKMGCQTETCSVSSGKYMSVLAKNECQLKNVRVRRSE